MNDVNAQGVDKLMINVHYFYYYSVTMTRPTTHSPTASCMLAAAYEQTSCFSVNEYVYSATLKKKKKGRGAGGGVGRNVGSAEKKDIKMSLNHVGPYPLKMAAVLLLFFSSSLVFNLWA